MKMNPLEIFFWVVIPASAIYIAYATGNYKAFYFWGACLAYWFFLRFKERKDKE